MTRSNCKLILGTLWLLGFCTPAAATAPDASGQWVTANYIAVLGRTPDAGGWIYLNQQMHIPGALTQTQLTIALMASAEYCGSFGLGSGCTPPNDQFLSTLYQRALGRPVDPSGSTYYTQLMANGTTQAQVVALIIASGEFQGDHGSFISSFVAGYTNPLAFVTSVTGNLSSSASAVGGVESPVTVTFSDQMGWGDVQSGQIQIGQFGIGCYLSWDNKGNVILYTAGGPVSGSTSMGTILTGSSCSINLAHSNIGSVNWNKDALAITLAITFSEQSMLGQQQVYAYGTDVYGQATAWAELGALMVNQGKDFTIDVSPSDTPPGVVYVPPNGSLALTVTVNGLNGFGQNQWYDSVVPSLNIQQNGNNCFSGPNNPLMANSPTAALRSSTSPIPVRLTPPRW